MSVEIHHPAELEFRRPFTVEVAQSLFIKNPNKDPVAFKVKTTAPKQYCVRPNSGRIEPGQDVEVTVLLQAMKQDPPVDARCRDKFLVQSVLISADLEFTNVTQLWDSVDKSKVQEKKIRVNWLPPADQAATTPARKSLANGVESTPDVPPPAYSSPGDDSRVVDDTQYDQAEHDVDPDASTVSAAATLATVKSAAKTAVAAVPTTGEELKEQLAKAQEKIVQLTQELQSGLRQRKNAASSDEKGSATEQLATAVRQGTEGVPIKIAALLCLVSFLLAYFFF